MSAVELKQTGTMPQPVRELWCGCCGYGVVVRRDPPDCPMCRGSTWRARPKFARYN
jgi:hypothetical protein